MAFSRRGFIHLVFASHAIGRGFSSAQYYPGINSCEARLEIAVVDAGRGFLHHVKRKEISITTDKEALAWCLKKLNTATDPPQTENNEGSWGDPFAEIAHRTGQRDHHMGLGLWLLTELVRSAHGDLWIWSGNASCKIQRGGEPTFNIHDISWKGVAIEIVFYPDRIPSLDRPQSQSTIDEDLLERELLS